MKNIERLTPVFRPGWDCITGTHCEHAGQPGLNHGIHGDEYIYALRTELDDGRMAAMTLLVYTSRFPSSVERSRVDSIRGTGLHKWPRGASLDLHLQLAKGAAAPTYQAVHECEWLGSGRKCASDGSCLIAHEVYERSGIQDDSPGVDLMQQPDALYAEMERFLRLWTEGNK